MTKILYCQHLMLELFCDTEFKTFFLSNNQFISLLLLFCVSKCAKFSLDSSWKDRVQVFNKTREETENKQLLSAFCQTLNIDSGFFLMGLGFPSLCL